MATSATKTVLAATGGVVAAVVSTLCCAGPRVAVAPGLSGAGLAATFEPLRPYFVAGTVLALGFGFVVVRGEEKRACEPGTLCASPIARRRMKWALWIATIVSIHRDRKSTRLNSSHLVISYAVFCLKKKKKHQYSIVYCLQLVSPHVDTVHV